MKHSMKAAVLALALIATPLAAQTNEMLTDGEVRRVDKERERITLRHEEIKNMAMPPMTMVFRVKEAAMLDQVKVGDKVKFTAEDVKGAITIMKIEPVPATR